jgi:hypothetical protein
MTRPLTYLANAPAALAETGWSTVDVSEYVTDLLSLGAADYGLALSGAESSAGLWARIAGSDTGEAAQFGPRLVVNWSGVRPTPVLPAIDTALTESPTLTWSLPFMAGVQDRFEVQLSRDGFTTIEVDSGAIKGADGKAGTWAVPADALTSTASYSWRVRVHSASSANWSEWSAPQSFNFTLPTPPVIPVNAVL